MPKGVLVLKYYHNMVNSIVYVTILVLVVPAGFFDVLVSRKFNWCGDVFEFSLRFFYQSSPMCSDAI